MRKTAFSIIICILAANTLFAQLDFTNPNALKDSLLIQMDQKITKGDYERITSVLVARDGKVLFEKYYNDAGQSTLHNTRSATKTIATLLTGIAIDKGFVGSEKDKIYKYLQHKMPAQNPDPRKGQITIEDLLTMSSIMECNDNDSYSRGNEGRMYIIEDWAQFFVDLPIRSFPFGPKPKELPYGRSMSYCSAGSAAVAEVLQSAVGMKIHEFGINHLLNPLGIKDYKLHFTPMGILNTAGGSEYRSRDFLKLIQMCLQKGKWEGKQLISAAWIDKATSPKVNAWEGMDYGYLFWLRKYGKDKGVSCYAMAGNGGNKIVAFPRFKPYSGPDFHKL